MKKLILVFLTVCLLSCLFYIPCINSVYALTKTTVFSDDFETGELNGEWDFPGGSVQSNIKKTGSYALNISFGAAAGAAGAAGTVFNSSYFYDYYSSFWFLAYDLGSWPDSIYGVYDIAGVSFLDVNVSSGSYFLIYQSPNGTYYDLNQSLVTDTWYNITVHTQLTNSSAFNGIANFTIYVDSAVRGDYSDIPVVWEFWDGTVPFFFVSGAESIYFFDDIQVYTLTSGASPTIGEFVAPSAVYGNTYFWLNATINDADGIQTIKNATVEIGGGVILGWVNGTGFMEIADPAAFCTLDTANSTTVDINATAIKICWYLSLNTEYQDGPVNIVSDHTVAYDTTGNSGSNSQPAAFTFNDAVGGGDGGGGGGGSGDSGGGTVDFVADPPQVIKDIAEALNISPLGVYAILAALGLITLGGITATTSRVRKRKSSSPRREYRG